LVQNIAGGSVYDVNVDTRYMVAQMPTNVNIGSAGVVKVGQKCVNVVIEYPLEGKLIIHRLFILYFCNEKKIVGKIFHFSFNLKFN